VRAIALGVALMVVAIVHDAATATAT
jgi:hypothetical protein